MNQNAGIRMLENVLRELDSNVLDNNRLDALHMQIDHICCSMNRIAFNLGEDFQRQIFEVSQALQNEYETETGNRNNGSNLQIHCSVCYGRGRPSFIVKEEQLCYLLENRFSAVEIASMLCISLRTVRRRISEYNLTNRYTVMTDETLDEMVSDICKHFHNIGYRLVMGQLALKEVYLSRTRVLESLRRVDPFGVLDRLLTGPTIRRSYSVAGPLSLWHIDGNHKLIRYQYQPIVR